jgi:hypothetical protein
MNQIYAAFIAELRSRKARLEAELKDVEAAIASTLRLIGEGPEPAQSAAQLVTPAPAPLLAQALPKPHKRFANISVRWGVLWHLAEDANGYEKTGEIASALLAGGYRTEATNFSNMVSAVLSNMKVKGEVETAEDGGYRLTADGHQTWALIKQGAKFRMSTSPSEHSLLSVQ